MQRQVKAEWDKDSQSGADIRVVVLGSPRLMLQKGLTESLAGRFETTYLGHWSFVEMKAASGLSAEELVWFGGYRGASGLRDKEDGWKSYVRDLTLGKRNVFFKFGIFEWKNSFKY